MLWHVRGSLRLWEAEVTQVSPSTASSVQITATVRYKAQKGYDAEDYEVTFFPGAGLRGSGLNTLQHVSPQVSSRTPWKYADESVDDKAVFQSFRMSAQHKEEGTSECDDRSSGTTSHTYKPVKSTHRKQRQSQAAVTRKKQKLLLESQQTQRQDMHNSSSSTRQEAHFHTVHNETTPSSNTQFFNVNTAPQAGHSQSYVYISSSSIHCSVTCEKDI